MVTITDIIQGQTMPHLKIHKIEPQRHLPTIKTARNNLPNILPNTLILPQTDNSQNDPHIILKKERIHIHISIDLTSIHF